MKRIGLVTLVSTFALAACATAESTKSYTPTTVVVVKAPRKKAPEANYRVSPEESRLVTGSGGSAK